MTRGRCRRRRRRVLQEPLQHVQRRRWRRPKPGVQVAEEEADVVETEDMVQVAEEEPVESEAGVQGAEEEA